MLNHFRPSSISCIVFAAMFCAIVPRYAHSQGVDYGGRHSAPTTSNAPPTSNAATQANFLQRWHSQPRYVQDANSVDAMWNFAVRRPTYKVLPRLDYDGQTTPNSPKPITLGRPSQPYAYGWFGVQPSPLPIPAYNLRRRYNRIIFK